MNQIQRQKETYYKQQGMAPLPLRRYKNTLKEAYYKQQGMAPGVPTEKGAYGDPENTGVGYNAVLTELGNHDVPQG